MRAELRFITYLAPSIPRQLFETVARHVERTLRLPVSLRLETRWSGPVKNRPDPFSVGAADVGFMCSPSYLWMRDLRPSPVELLPAAPVYWDERAAGKPVYFSDVIVRAGAPYFSFADLEGYTWAYNDSCSLSGYYNLLKKLGELRRDAAFFRRVLQSGSHLRSIELVACGEADAAAIDSNVLRLQMRLRPELQASLRVLESWGPYPIQPVVVRSALPASLRLRIGAALLGLEEDGESRAAVESFGMRGFATVGVQHYEAERAALESCERLGNVGAAGSRLGGVEA